MLSSQGNEAVESMLMTQYGNNRTGPSRTLLFDHVSPATRLLEKRRQMFEVQDALNAQKDEFSRREDAFRRREDALRSKDLELQESLIKFNKFLQENELKRNRALKRVSDEKKQRELKEVEIKKLEQLLAMKIEEESNLKFDLEKNIKYQDYLEMIVQSISKYFPEIVDILNRHKVLKDANKTLIMKQVHEEEEQDKLNREYIQYKKAKENQILNANNEVAELQIKLESLKSKSSRLQQEVDQRMNETTQKSLFLGQIIASVSNLLQRCEENFSRRHNKPNSMIDHGVGYEKQKLDTTMSVVAQSERTLASLDWIALYINDFKDIRNDYIEEFGQIVPQSVISQTRGSRGGSAMPSTISVGYVPSTSSASMGSTSAGTSRAITPSKSSANISRIVN
jgi:hypothetical protein